MHTPIRLVFCNAWRGEVNKLNGSDILADRMGWPLSRDFDGHPDLLIAGLRLLIPEITVTRPVYALYRGRSLAEHQAGRHSCGRAPEQVHAELFGLMPNRNRSGPGAVVVACAPKGHHCARPHRVPSQDGSLGAVRRAGDQAQGVGA